MPALSYTISDFQPFTLIRSSDINSRFNDIKTLLNTTKLDSANVQQYGLTRDRLAAGTANYVLINDGSGNISQEQYLATTRGGTGFSPTISGATAGQAIVVNNAGNALALGTPSVDKLIEGLDAYTATLTAGEAITANNAVAIDIGRDASNNNIYRIFNADKTTGNRKSSFLGFATANATVTAGIYTWVASANFVTSNVITYSINGRAYSTNFTTDNATTLQAVATQMATDPDVNGAVSDGVHTVTVTGKGALFINITGSTVTGGASQATITVTNTQAPVGGSVKIQAYGPMSGFSGLTFGNVYYVQTAGAITNAPTDSIPVAVGVAVSSTVLYVNAALRGVTFPTALTLVKSHGTTKNVDDTGVTGAVEHFNFSSWSAGTTDISAVLWGGGCGEAILSGKMYHVDGRNSSGTRTLSNGAYNKTTWATSPNRTKVCTASGQGTLSGKMYFGGGTNTTNAEATVDSFDGSSWVNTACTNSAAAGARGCAVYSGKIRFVAGYINNTPTYTNVHDTFDGVSTGTDTVAPILDVFSAGLSSASNNMVITGNNNGTASYQWSGSWSSNIANSYTSYDHANVVNSNVGAAVGFNSGAGNSYIVGGTNTTTVSAATLKTSAKFNGASWSSDTPSTNSTSGGVGGCI